MTAMTMADTQRFDDAIVDQKNIALQHAEQLAFQDGSEIAFIGQPRHATQPLTQVGQVRPLAKSFARPSTPDALPTLPNNFSRLEPYHFDLRQQWEGIVQSVDGENFTAVLHDLTHGASEHEATLPTEEVSAPDLKLLKPGAVFYWSIGYKRHRSGQQERISAIRMRRLPGWSRRDIDAIEQRATELEKLLGSPPSDSSQR